MAVTDLTGTKWQIKKPSEFVGTRFKDGTGYSIITSELTYKIYASTYESAEQNNIVIREFYDRGIYSGAFVATSSPFVYPMISVNTSGGVKYYTDSSTSISIGDVESTIEITGGTGVTNSDLISWLQANATQVIEPSVTPSISIGSLSLSDVYVGNTKISKIFLGSTLLWEKETPVPENALLAQDGKLFASGGGYLITTEVTLITFTIEGRTQQAVEGMTWQEWVNSSYNNDYDTYEVSGDEIVTTSTASGDTYRVFLYLFPTTTAVPVAPSSIIGSGVAYHLERIGGGGSND